MQKQKICVIGGGISGLIVAATIAKSNIKVDLIAKDFYSRTASCRTTAISNSNYLFLKKFNILKSNSKLSWACEKMELYDSFKNLKSKKILNFDAENVENSILHIITNKNLNNILKEKIKNNNNISIKSNIFVSKLFSHNGLKYVKTSGHKVFKYNLIIVCSGKNSSLTSNLLGNRHFKHNYNEVAITQIISHKKNKNNIARQFFLREGPMAFLPISKSKTSIVWSIKKSFFEKQIKKRESFLRKKIKHMTKEIYKDINFNSKFEFNNLSFYLEDKYFIDRVLVFGDALYSVHPIAGQGFNMILRDLKKLNDVIRKKISSGLDVGSALALSEFADQTQSNNFIYLTGIKTIKNIMTSNNTTLVNLRNYFMAKLNNTKKVKKLFINAADTGINF
jgi:2-octaprenyl-6-methoxyphenol hydroxylase